MKKRTKSKAIGLLRVSSTAQAGPERHGLPAQREACERVAATYNLEIVEWVELEGVSGAAVLRDVRFAALLKRIESPEITGVVVAAFDRLFRRGNFADFAILDVFAETGTALYSPDGRQDLNKESDGLLSIIRGELAGMERRRITERTSRARERIRRERGIRAEGGGKFGMPRGVRFDQKTRTWSYDPVEADRIRQGYQLFLSGVTNFREIARQIGLKHLKGPSTAIRTMLSNPIYKGIYRVDKRWLGGGRWEPRAPEDCHEHQVLDPLIAPADWDRAQKLLGELSALRPPVLEPESRPVTYHGHLLCSLCGAMLQTHRDSRGTWSYFCPNTPKSKKGCERGYSGVRKADPQLDAELVEYLGDLENLERVIDESAAVAARRARSPAPATAADISRLQNQLARVKDAYVEGAFTLEDMLKRSEAIESEIAVLDGLMTAPGPEPITPEQISEVVAAFALWDLQTREEKRAQLKALGLRIWTSKPGRARIRVDKVEVGLLGCAVIYKKMKRLGIE